MNTKLRATALALAIASASAIPTSANAYQGIGINALGTGVGFTITDEWVWTNSTILFQNAVTAAGGADSLLATDGSPPRIFVQGQLAQARRDGVGVTLNDAPEVFTFEMSLVVDATRSVPLFGSPDSTFASVNYTMNGGEDYGSDNWFRLYHSPEGIDTVTGAGFGAGSDDAIAGAHAHDQTLILDGKVTLSPDFATNIFVSASGTHNLGDNATADTKVLSGNLNVLVDVCTADEISGATPGSICFGKALSTVDENFIVNTIFDDFLFNVSFTDNVVSPFPTNKDVPNEIVGETPDLSGTGKDTDDASALNSLKCEEAAGPCDIIAALPSISTFWNASVAPEPGSLALLGLSMLGMGAAARRRRKS